MQNLPLLDRLLREVGSKYDIPHLRLDSDGSAGLELKNGIFLYFEYIEDTQRLLLYSPVIDIPVDISARLALFDALLEMNFLESTGSRGTLASFKSIRQVVYQVGLDIAMLDGKRLDEALHHFLTQRQDALYKIQRVKAPPASAGSHSLKGASTADRLARLCPP